MSNHTKGNGMINPNDMSITGIRCTSAPSMTSVEMAGITVFLTTWATAGLKPAILVATAHALAHMFFC
jgi:hypothetical protein